MNYNSIFVMVATQLVLCQVIISEAGHLPLGQTSQQTNDQKQWNTLNGFPSLLVGHRGEKVYMPEHTVGSYQIASIESPEYIEPDLVMTKDGQLVCFHDLTLKKGTNIENVLELAHLKGLTIKDDWCIPDLTLLEIKKIRVKQANVGIRPQYFNDVFQIPTLEEFIGIIHEMNFKMNTSFGIIPEIKHPEIVNEKLGKPNFMENELLRVLRYYGYPIHRTDIGKCKFGVEEIFCGHVVIQSFNKEALSYLSKHTDIDLMILVETDPLLLTMKELEVLSKFVRYYTVWKGIVYSGIEPVLIHNDVRYNTTEIENAGGFIPTHNLSTVVHSLGLNLGIYTVYDSREPSKLGCEVKCITQNKTEEMHFYFDTGVDIIFVENIKEASDLRNSYSFNLLLQETRTSSAQVHKFYTASSISMVILYFTLSYTL